MTNPLRPIINTGLCILVALALSGCAKKPTNPEDPYEPFNRAMFGFNMALDHMIYRPAAEVYMAVTPVPLQAGIGNAFDNLGEITTVPNDVLQGKFKYALMDTWRFIINSTVGIAGLFDIASRMGLPKHSEDFGMTLAYYSDNKKAPYLVMPLLGPMTLRSGLGRPVDYLTSPWIFIRSNALTYSLFALKWVNVRAQFMTTNQLMDTAFDPYAFLRSAYLQNRFQSIRDNEHDYRPNPSKTTKDKLITVRGDADVTPLNTKEQKSDMITISADKTTHHITQTKKPK